MSIQHEDTVQIHKFAYVGTISPGAVGADKAWVDTSKTPYQLYIRNTNNSAWLAVGPWDADLNAIAGLNPPNGHVIYRASGEWSTIHALDLKDQMELENVQNVDTTLRTNHVGTQLASTISNFNSAVDARINITTLQETAIVSGAGDATVNGIYTYRGIYNAKAYYNLEGLASNPIVSSVVFKSNYWYITNAAGQDSYRIADADTATPFDVEVDNVSQRPGILVGPAPSPSLSIGSLRAIREDFRPNNADIGSRFIFREGTAAGSNYAVLAAPYSLSTNRTYMLPDVAFRTPAVIDSRYGAASVLLTDLGRQDIYWKLNHVSASVANNIAEGQVISDLVAGEAIAQWECVYLNTSQQVRKADANGANTYPAWGLALNSAGIGVAVGIFTQGTVRNDAWNWTANDTIYMSTTAGALTNVAPSTGGDKVQIVGRAIGPDTAYFNFNSIYTTV